jgi:polysaccharide deacetylase 2 family uncharacterized protein YibQ
VLSQIRKEHSQWGLTWIETQRTISVTSLDDSAAIAGRFKSVADHLGCSLEKRQTSQAVEIQIKRFVWPLERMTLTVARAPTERAAGQLRQVAFVIDDVAYVTEPMDRFASLGIPLTFAILPREKHSKQLSEKATALHFPVMLHLPMEPLDLAHNDPGPSGLYLKMSDQELKKQFDRDVASVPNIVGINNHMGSAFTENEPKMSVVLPWVKKRGLYFLDSHTSVHSVVRKVAKRIGVPCLINDTFLDNVDEVKAIEGQLDLVMKLALERGQTIAIGHYRRKYLVQAIANKLPEFKSHGVQIVTLPVFFHQ